MLYENVKPMYAPGGKKNFPHSTILFCKEKVIKRARGGIIKIF